MHIARTLHLKNVVVFKDVSVRLDKNPLTFVRGVNYDADAADPTSNGVGKSLLFGSIFNVLRGRPPTAVKKRGNKDLFSTKTTQLEYEFQNDDGPLYKIIQKPGGYSLFSDGKDLELTGKTAPVQYIERLFPLSDTELYTHVFLTSLRDYPILVADDLERLNCIVDLFRLDQYTAVKDRLLQKLRGIADLESKVSVHQANLLKYTKQLDALPADDVDLDGLKRNIRRVTKALDALKDTQHDIRKQLRTAEYVLEVEQKLEKYRAEYRTWGVKVAPEEYRKQLGKLLPQVREYAGYLKAQRRYKDQSSELRERLAELGEIKPVDDERLDQMVEEYSNYEQDLHAYEHSLETYQTLRDKVRDLKSQLEDCGDLSEEEIREQLAQCKLILSLGNLVHDHEGDDDDAKCPTCLQSVDLKAITKQLKVAKSRKAKLEDELLRLQAFARYETMREKLAATEKPVKPEDKSHLKAEIRELKASRTAYREYRDLKTKLSALEKPVVVDKPDTDLTEEEIEDRQDFCHRIEKLLAEKTAHDVSYHGIKKAKLYIAKLESELESVDTDVSQKQEELSSYTDSLRQHEHLETQRRMLHDNIRHAREEIATAKPTIALKKVYEVLVKAYGNKGLRSMAARSVCSLIEKNLNLYRGAVFAEPFHFSVKVSERGVSILVDPGNGNPARDVRLLSGAESDSFRALFAISTLPLVPQHRRVNIMILDEPCAHMDSVNRALFFDRFLPLLRTVVPNIYIITPNLDDVAPNSAEWVIVKKKGISTLKEQ